MKTITGKLNGKGLKIAIITARFNDFIGSKLQEGAIDGLIRHEVAKDDITIHLVPGAFEIPLTAQRVAQSQSYDAIICLGAVIRGATTHYDYVCNEVAKGIAQVSLRENIPVIFGVLTTENIEQAIERAGTKAGNKGFEAAMSALEMAQVLRQLPSKV